MAPDSIITSTDFAVAILCPLLAGPSFESSAVEGNGGADKQAQTNIGNQPKGPHQTDQ
jgi:hypothetical protein